MLSDQLYQDSEMLIIEAEARWEEDWEQASKEFIEIWIVPRNWIDEARKMETGISREDEKDFCKRVW